MSDNIAITEPLIVSAEQTNVQRRPNIYDMQVNYTNQNKWFGYFPLQNILGRNFEDLNLHLTRFSLPQQTMMTDTVSYKGYSKSIPLKVLNPDTKELTLEYIVDEHWRNYKALYNWMSGIYGTINPVTDTSTTEKISPSDYLPLRIYLLDNFKKKVVQFLFEDCFIQVFNDIALDVANSDIVTHSFTICYDKFSIEDID